MSAPFSGIAIQPELVLNLADVISSMLPIVGGKAANLGELIHAGLPVPPGFCVTTEAYRQVAASANIDYDALAVVGTKRPAESGPYPPSDHAGGNGVEVLALRARDALLGAAMPRAISRAVVESYQSLGENVPVAVRSSATAEDLPFASFAGQQDTYLHIIGTDAVIGAVRRCWASLWTERAVVYRTNSGIDHRAVRLAVVVQRMVDAKVAGVLFTANPITGHRRQAVLDANPGLGEAVVSGAVNPDHFVVDTDGRQILERRLGDKRVEVRSLPGGGTERVEKSAGADRACLTDDQILALAALGDLVEKHFGAPQDIEWAIDSAGKLWLTQSRPITTLFPLPKPRVAQASKPGEENLRAYLCFSLAQGLTRPITPMGLAGFRLLASAVARLFGFPVEDAFDGPAVYAEAGQRIFIDLTGVLRSRVGRALMPRVLDVMESRSAVILRTLLEDPRLSIVTRSRLPFLRRVQRIAFRYGIPAKVIQALARPDKAHARAEELGAELDLGSGLAIPRPPDTLILPSRC